MTAIYNYAGPFNTASQYDTTSRALRAMQMIKSELLMMKDNLKFHQQFLIDEAVGSIDFARSNLEHLLKEGGNQ